MDIEEFMQIAPPFARSPCLYIVKQMADEAQNAHRCGASGTMMFAGADLPYGSEKSTSTGLLRRLRSYYDAWLPVKGKIFAALRIKEGLVAEVERDRVATDFQGGTYNVDRGSRTLVLSREAEFHAALDRRGLRWDSSRKNELFKPKKTINELIAALRTVKGEALFLMSPGGTILQDETYRGGSRHETIRIRETTTRQLPERTAHVPSITIRLSKDSLDQLRSANPQQFSRLLNIVRAYDDFKNKQEEVKKEEPTTVRMSGADIEKLRRAMRGDRPVSGLGDAFKEVFKPRRSARIAARAAVTR